MNSAASEEFEPESIDVILSVGTGNQPIVKSNAAKAVWPGSVLDAYKAISGKLEIGFYRN